MSVYGRLVKNVENFVIQDVYKNMTPEQFQKGVQFAVNKVREDLTKDYEYRLAKERERFAIEIQERSASITDIISVELLYELARQMDCFNENTEYLEDKIARVQEIYNNTMEAIKRYSKSKNNNQKYREFNKKKKLMNKMFNLKF